jgi:hypothetical protein
MREPSSLAPPLPGRRAASPSPKTDPISFKVSTSRRYLVAQAAQNNNTTGQTNGSNGLAPLGGASNMAELTGFTYTYGPFSIGVIGAIIGSQGNAELVGTS